MKIRYLIMFLALIAAFTGCIQAQPATESDGPTAEEKQEIVMEIPEDYEGVWNRTSLTVDGAPNPFDPAVLTLNKNDYTSVGSCLVTGQVISDGKSAITLTIDSTDCPGVSAGPGVPASYSIMFDEERDVEVMTITTANIVETYDRQG